MFDTDRRVVLLYNPRIQKMSWNVGRLTRTLLHRFDVDLSDMSKCFWFLLCSFLLTNSQQVNILCTVSQKKNPDIINRNLRTVYQILIIFGITNVHAGPGGEYTMVACVIIAIHLPTFCACKLQKCTFVEAPLQCHFMHLSSIIQLCEKDQKYRN